MTTPDALSCQELVELVTDYLEGALSPPDQLRFDAHLAQCRGCRNYLEQMRQTIHLIGSLPAEALSSAMRQELLAVFRHWKNSIEP